MSAMTMTRVLLVEDDPGDALLVETLLGRSRFDRFGVATAECLAQALNLAYDHPPDAVLLDLSLPDSSGMRTVRTFRQAAPDLPVIVLTGVEDRDVGIEALKEGCQDYLVKGHGDGESIARAILHSIQRKQLEAELVRAKEENRLAKEEYRLLVDSSPDAILVCTETEAALINHAARRLCHNGANLRGRPFACLFSPRDAPLVGALIRDILHGARESGVLEAHLRGSDGDMREPAYFNGSKQEGASHANDSSGPPQYPFGG